LTIILNTTGNPITREERIKINENWTRIISGLTDLQFQINALAGGEDVDDLIKSIKQAIDDALLAISKIETATDNANLATQDAINATNTALTKIGEIEVLIAESMKLNTESTKLNTESAKLNTEAKQNIAQMTTIITTGNQLISDLTALKADIQTAVIQAQVALEQVYGWGTSTPWSNVETYIKNNIVTHNGSTWQSLVNDNLNNEPSELSPHWILMAKRGSSNKLVAHADKLATTSIGQVVWDLPSDYNPVTDTIMFYFNTVYLRPSEYTITGDDVAGYKLNYTSPETAIADNNIDTLIFKNVPVNDLGQIDGMDLVNGSVTLDKLGQDVKNAIQAGGGGGTVTIDIINDLVSGGATKALSAEQGKVLNGLIDSTNTTLGQVSSKTDKNITDLEELTNKVDNHVGENNIHVTSTDKSKWDRKADTYFVIASGVDQSDPNKHAELYINSNGRTQKYITTHANVQNSNETGKKWAVTTEQSGSSGSYIQTAYKLDDNKGDFKTRYLTGTNGTGTWSTWSPSQAELFQSVSNGKALVASAITGKGVVTASDATFQTMADNISAIQTGGATSMFSKTNQVRPDNAKIAFNDIISASSVQWNVITINSPIKPLMLTVTGTANNGSLTRIRYGFSWRMTREELESSTNTLNLYGVGTLTQLYYDVLPSNNQTSSYVRAIDFNIQRNNATGEYTMHIPTIQDSAFGNDSIGYNVYVMGEGNTIQKVPLSTASIGDFAVIDGDYWQVLNPSTGMLWYAGDKTITTSWDETYPRTGRSRLFNPTKTQTLAYRLNNDYYNSLESTFKNAIKTKVWNIGTELNESATTVSAKIGLLSYSEWNQYKNILKYAVPLSSSVSGYYSYMITQYSSNADYIYSYSRAYDTYPAQESPFDVFQYGSSEGVESVLVARPVIYLDTAYEVQLEKN